MAGSSILSLKNLVAHRSLVLAALLMTSLIQEAQPLQIMLKT